MSDGTGDRFTRDVAKTLRDYSTACFRAGERNVDRKQHFPIHLFIALYPFLGAAVIDNFSGGQLEKLWSGPEIVNSDVSFDRRPHLRQGRLDPNSLLPNQSGGGPTTLGEGQKTSRRCPPSDEVRAARGPFRCNATGEMSGHLQPVDVRGNWRRPPGGLSQDSPDLRDLRF